MQHVAPAGRPRFGPLVAAGLGFLAFLYFFDARILDPTRIDWVSSNDMATNFLGWHFFRHEPWSWPPGLLANYANGTGASIAITDSVPLAAFLLKPFDAWLPPDFNYLGIWIALCFTLQGHFAFRLLQALGVPAVRALAGALLLCLLPFMAARATLHVPLASHWLLTAALWLYLDSVRDAARFRRWCVLMPVAALVNPYLFVTIGPVFMASAAALLWKGPPEARRPVLAHGAAATALSLAALWLMGFGTVSVANTWGFYGQLQVNLLAWFNSLGVGTLLPRLPVAEVGQTDAYMYLGVGGIVVLAVGSWQLWRARARIAPPYVPLALAMAAVLAAAISHRVALGPWFVIDLHPLPQALQDLLNPFRSSGRLAWLPTYLAMALAIAGCARLGPRAFALLIVGAIGLNLADGRQIRGAGQTVVERAAHPGSPTCDALPAAARRVVFVPQVALEDLSIASIWSVAVCAARQNQPINVGALARTDLARFDASAREAAQWLDRKPAPDQAYAYANPAAAAALGAGASTPKLADYRIFVPTASGAPEAPAPYDPAWAWPLEVEMGVMGRGRHVLLWGWTPPLPNSVRSWSDRVALLLPVPPAQAGEARLRLAARPMPQGAGELTLQVKANGTALGPLVLPRSPELNWHTVRIPAEVVGAARGALRVEFTLPALAPFEPRRNYPDDRLRFSIEHLVLAAHFPHEVKGRIRGFSADSAMLGRGWSGPEPWGVWSAERVATLRIPVPEGAGRDLRLRFFGHAISRTGRQDVRVLVAGQPVASWSFLSQQPSERREAVIPAALVPAGAEDLEIAFEIASPGPPANSPDTRNLGIGLVDFELARM